MLVKIKQDTRELFADKVSLSHLSIKAVSDSNRRQKTRDQGVIKVSHTIFVEFQHMYCMFYEF